MDVPFIEVTNEIIHKVSGVVGAIYLSIRINTVRWGRRDSH
jgi:hypothetical protein